MAWNLKDLREEIAEAFESLTDIPQLWQFRVQEKPGIRFAKQEKHCLYCGKELPGKRSHQKFCSKPKFCGALWRYHNVVKKSKKLLAKMYATTKAWEKRHRT